MQLLGIVNGHITTISFTTFMLRNYIAKFYTLYLGSAHTKKTSSSVLCYNMQYCRYIHFHMLIMGDVPFLPLQF